MRTRRVDQAELVAQDAVVVERARPPRGRRGSRRAARPRPPRRARARGRSAARSRRTSLAVIARVRREHVVLVALGEARADALAVLAVGAQDRDLRASPGPATMTSRLSESDSASPRQTAAMHSRDAVAALRRGRAAGRSGRARRSPAARVAVAAQQPRRDLLDHAQPEVLEHRHRLGELDLVAALVERRRA